jgi:transposase
MRVQFHGNRAARKPAAMKALALLLYAMANVSFCSIARLLKVSDVAVLK